MKEVHPKTLYANGLWNIFTNRKKYKIVCGECGYTYSDKVYFLTDDAISICPGCGVRNKWSHSEFNKFYERHSE